MMKNHRISTRNQSGFTIVELMIATMVFSVVIFIITAGVLAFTRSYYKGINSSTTQNAARSVVDTISQAIQFSGRSVVETNLADPNNGYFCAGDYVYMISLGKKVPDNPIHGNWGIYQAANPEPGSCGALSGPTSDGTELLGSQMRVADISVAKVSGETRLYSVSLRIAFGDSDLLCSPGLSGTTKGSCNKGATSYGPNATWHTPDMTCKTQTGSQFCAVSALSTTALQRVKPNN
jgi:prepilin-type N-terminal cleavage/methylation domain-containing protein